MKNTPFSITYDGSTGIIDNQNIPDRITKKLLKECKVSKSVTGGKTMYFVNPYLYDVDRPCPLLLSLFSDYLNDNSNDIKYEHMTYQKYLKTDYWKAFRQKALEHYGRRCDWCGSQGNSIILHVHHVRYDKWFDEKLENVILLCSDCHRKAHGKSFKNTK